MKKILLIFLVLSGLIFARDYEYRERKELEETKAAITIPARMNIESYFGENSLEYTKFMKKFDDMN